MTHELIKSIMNDRNYLLKIFKKTTNISTKKEIHEKAYRRVRKRWKISWEEESFHFFSLEQGKIKFHNFKSEGE